MSRLTDAVSLAAIGFDARVEGLFAQAAPPGTVPGRISRVDRGAVSVLLERDATRAEVTPSLRRLADLGDPAATPAVGDWVAVRRRPQHALDVVESILDRRSAFIRAAVHAHGEGRKPLPQVLAANVDIAFLVAAATDVRQGRLERIGVAAWESGAQPVIVLTKADLVADPSRALREAESAVPGAPVLLVDGVRGEGVEAVRAHLAGNRTGTLIGASGVGKSTLTNALVGTDVLAVGGVREADGRGRHTTTARHLVPLPGGGALIDTPGVRSIETWGASAGIDRVFADVEALAEACRFRDCSHQREPGCAVRDALERGDLDPARFRRYQRVDRERAYVEERDDPLAVQARQAERRRINRWLRGREDVQRKRGKQ